MANENAAVFKPDDVVIEFEDGSKYRLIYDLNAFCELEKIYDSVDAVIQMVLGTQENVDPEKLLTQVKIGDMPVDGKTITIAGTPLLDYVKKVHTKQAKHSDTLNLLWAGCLHDAAQYNQFDEITGYTVSKSKLGSYVTFKNLREINAKIIVALLRDLIPPKNVEEESEVKQPAPEKKAVLQFTPSEQ